MQVTQAHKALESFSGQNAGIGISIELIRRLLFDQLKRVNSHFQMMDSNEKFKAIYQISFSGEFDTSNLKFKFSNFVNPNDSSEFSPQVEISNLKLNIKGFLEGKNAALISIDFQSITGVIQLVNKKMEISLFEEIHNESNHVRQWELDSGFRSFFESNPYNFIKSDWDALATHFKAISIFSARDIAEAFITSIEFPDIFKIFNGIKFGNDSKIGANNTGDLLMFTANSSIDFMQCPIYNATGKTSVESKSKVNGNPNPVPIGAEPTNDGKITVETTITKDSENLKYPVNNDKESERYSTGDVFLFTPIELLKINFNVVKPAVTASDSGKFGLIRWGYSVTASIKELRLNLIKSWPIEFRLSIPAEVTGQARAGVKLGCIRYEAVGAMFDGLINPFDINFKIDLDWASMQIVFISKIENIKGTNFSFRTFPGLKFPISQIIDFILGRAAEFIITEQADRILNVTRIPIANLNILNRFAKIRQNHLAGETDSNGNVTIGVELQNI